MNRFETLLAPPSLTAKELGVHLKMHPELPADVAAACRNQLVNVSVRMHDELSTVRFPARLTSEPEPAEYVGDISTMLKTDGDPIEWRFFAAEYEALAQGHPDVARVDIVKVAKGFEDPWRIQAWAAQALRVARSGETHEQWGPPKAWGIAIALYEEFFSRVGVEDSYSYRFASDDASKQLCRVAWDGFLANEVEALAGRLEEFASRQEAHSADIVAQTLALPEVKRLAPRAVDAALQLHSHHFAQGIRSATSLASALEMYSSAPESPERDRALLEALTAETKKLEKGFGDLQAIEAAAGRLGLGKEDSGDPALLKAAKEEYYDAAAAVSRVAINQSDDDKDGSMCRAAIVVMGFVPGDREVGRDTDGDPVTAGGVLRSLRLHDMVTGGSGGTSGADVPASDRAQAQAIRLVRTLESTPSDSDEHRKARRELMELLVENPELGQLLGQGGGAKRPEPKTGREKKLMQVLEKIPMPVLKEFDQLTDTLVDDSATGSQRNEAMHKLALLMIQHPELRELMELMKSGDGNHNAAPKSAGGRRREVASSRRSSMISLVSLVALIVWIWGLATLSSMFQGQAVLQVVAVIAGIVIPSYLLAPITKRMAAPAITTINAAAFAHMLWITVFGAYAWCLVWLWNFMAGNLVAQIVIVALAVVLPMWGIASMAGKAAK